MHRVNVAGSREFHHYWRGRAVETQLRLSGTDSHELRGVYSELICHYQRMAQMYDGTGPHPTLV